MLIYANVQEVIKELGRGEQGECDVCGRGRLVWAFLALKMCGPCLTGEESQPAGGGDSGAVQVLKGPET